MPVKLAVVAGPHVGQEFTFDGHDTFLVGRVDDAHFRLSDDDPYFSRRQFVVEVNPPRCRVLDLKSRNGTFVNGRRVDATEIGDGDEIAAGTTVFKVSVVPGAPEPTLDLPAPAHSTREYREPERSRIAGYRLEEEIGRGGMGVVYRAVRDSDGLHVAIKTVTQAVGASPRHVERFVRECRILSQLTAHANVVRFLEVDESGGTIFLAMELVRGTDAKKLLVERGPLEVRTAVRLVCQALAGLAHAHGKGFVHRDIKPGNILIDGAAGSKRVAKLADFGLARVYESSKLSGLTMQGEVGGTPAYMAPEQVTHYRECRPAADQYSAAATLYNLLTDRPTHDLPNTVGAQLIHVATEPPVPIGDRRAGLPGGLVAAIHKALSREPKDRFPDALAFRTELRKFA